MLLIKKCCNIEVDKYGDKRYKVNGLMHRTDGPAYIGKNEKKWYYKGKLHRDDGPALENIRGYKVWYYHGHPHRIDGPARVFDPAQGCENEYWFYGKKCLSQLELDVAVEKYKNGSIPNI